MEAGTRGSGDESGGASGRSLRPARLRLTAVIAVAAAVAIVLWLALGGSSNESTPSGTPASGKSVAAVSEQGSADPRSGRCTARCTGRVRGVASQYELTQTSNGRIFVRYLPGGVKIGTGQRYPFVATFPFKDAYAGTASVAAEVDLGQDPGSWERRRLLSTFASDKRVRGLRRIELSDRGVRS